METRRFRLIPRGMTGSPSLKVLYIGRGTCLPGRVTPLKTTNPLQSMTNALEAGIVHSAVSYVCPSPNTNYLVNIHVPYFFLNFLALALRALLPSLTSVLGLTVLES